MAGILQLNRDLVAAGVSAEDLIALVRGSKGGSGGIPDLGNSGQSNIPPGARIVRVKVNANAAGGGKYLGWLVTSQAAAKVTETGNLAETELGTIPTDTTKYCLILNAAEVGQSTHDLTAGTPVAKVFIGYLLPRRSTTDRLVVVVNAFDWKACT